MTMPKKGRRKIVVKGKTFYYSVKPVILYATSHNGGRLTVQSTDGNHYCVVELRDQITPFMVRYYVEKNFDFLTGKNDHDLSKV
jgi:hypothetical protein